MLKPALDVLSGQVLFRDSFTQYGALSTYLQSLALWVSPSLLSIRIMTVASYAVTLILLYAVWRMILPRSLTIIACLLFILFIPTYELQFWDGDYWKLLPWSSVYAMVFQSMAIYALFQMIQSGQSRKWASILGFACACVLWTRQPVGIIMFGCLCVIWPMLLWSGWKPTGESRRSAGLRILAWFLALNLLMVAQLLMTGAWSDWWYQNVVWPSRWSDSVGSFYVIKMFIHVGTGAGLLALLIAGALPSLLRKFRPALSTRTVVAYFLCLALVLAWQHDWLLHVINLRAGGWSAVFPLVILAQSGFCIYSTIYKRDAGKTSEFYLTATLAGFSLGSLLQFYPLADPWHIIWSLAPAFGLIIYTIWRWLRWPAWAVAIGLSLAFLPAAWAKYRTASNMRNQPLVTLQEPVALRGMRLSPANAAMYQQIVAALRPVLKQQPDITSALIGKDAIFLCFTDNLENPSPYFVTWGGLTDGPKEVERWNYIHGQRPILFFHMALWAEVGKFYQRSHYTPILYIPELALEIAIPAELAKTIGIDVYGASPNAVPNLETKAP
ncbi:MAG: DUF4407 domain-containing protein [Cephaloticoccus sp.]|nr:DUF4407 domain-containing protein [Cephaloticoccus sp.]MCF7759717.1 DUF4407 domain-containing protein [Cephaloticoccus sp.]